MSAGRVRNNTGNGGRHDRQRGRGGRVALRQAEPDERGHDHRAAADAEHARQHPHQHADHNQHDDAARRPIKRRLPRSRFHLLRFRPYGIRPIRSFPFITHGSSFHVFRARYYPPAARSNQPIP